jgi:hypothetical protein
MTRPKAHPKQKGRKGTAKAPLFADYSQNNDDRDREFEAALRKLMRSLDSAEIERVITIAEAVKSARRQATVR